jgi:ATP-dependent Clp endopeptidase proteolytic subunit ClpP
LREAELEHGLFSMLAASGVPVTREASDDLAWDPLSLTTGWQPAVFFVATETYRAAPARVHADGPRSKVVMMPIGVPKVAYRVPGAPSADWVDIYNRLYRERIIFLGQEIDDELANQIIGVMLYLDSEDSTKPIYLYINCPGGSVIAGLAIFDTMNHIKSRVVTINVGLSASMASFLLCGGTKRSLLALPNSRVMNHQPMGGTQGKAEDLKVEASQIVRIKENLVNLYSMMTGQTTDQIIRDLDRDNFMSARKAGAYGIIDKIIDMDYSK